MGVKSGADSDKAQLAFDTGIFSFPTRGLHQARPDAIAHFATAAHR